MPHNFGAMLDNQNRNIMMNGSGPSKHQIGFKSSKTTIGERNQGFKAGGPIKATGAVLGGMES